MATPRCWRKTPFHDDLYRRYPGARLSASGLDVGLPAGQMGNSEVGHMNLGAGRIVYQDLTRINKAIADGDRAKPCPAGDSSHAHAEHGCTCSAWSRMAACTAITRTLSRSRTPPKRPAFPTSCCTPLPTAATLRRPAALIF